MANKKTALITGSYGGLGTCFVNIHAETGGDLILVGRNPDKLNVQKAEVEKKYSVTVHTITADLSLPDAAQNIYDTCKEQGWTVDYLINNAGFGGQGDFTREMLAIHYIRNTDLTTNDIAYLLGYQELNSFLRAFTAWTGTSITEYKKRLQ